MAPPIVVVPQYPSIPPAAGVPQLFRQVGTAFADAIILVADAINILNLFGPPKWGIYLNGALAIEPDSIFGIDLRNEWNLSTYPQEQGSFVSYNKVKVPYDFKVTMTFGGDAFERASFIAQVDAACNSLDLYDVVMPDGIFSSANPDHYDMRRQGERGGVGLITMDVWLTEVRVTGTAEFVSTAAPNGASPQSGGTVNPATPAPNVSALASAFT